MPRKQICAIISKALVDCIQYRQDHIEDCSLYICINVTSLYSIQDYLIYQVRYTKELPKDIEFIQEYIKTHTVDEMGKRI